MAEILELAHLKPLTTEQYDRCREAALRRVQARIGSRPQRQHFEREYARLWSVLDILALIIFIAALAVSSLHILTWSGREAGRVFDETGVTGWAVDALTFGRIHQLGLIAMSEASILLFTVMFRLTRNRVRWILLALAIGAVVFVFSANLASGIAPFVALLVPAFTVGISIRLEWLLVEGLKRRREVDEKYRAALAQYETASQDATQHPHYAAILRQELWQKIASLKVNQVYVDAPPALKLEAVNRELQRELWAYEGEQVTLPAGAYNLSPTAEVSTVETPLVTVTQTAPAVNGNGTGH